ncbi:hypothetical protein BGW80DRAFT_1456693 [Lactifluus volemus]|nr:hypothetical protein BGW80DRAFT_1456693 [Lactifluus volemus]
MSLSSLFDVSQPTDCLSAALNMLTEYEQANEENDWSKIAFPVFSLRHLTHRLITACAVCIVNAWSVPTLLSLLDILSAFYAKLAKLLGPSPFPIHARPLAPHPCVSYLFHDQMSADESLCCITLGSTLLSGTAGQGGPPGPLNSPPPSWTPALGEHVLKKIISVLLKDLDVFARNSIKDELASLDPLLRNVGGWSVPVGNGDEGRATYEFDPEH